MFHVFNFRKTGKKIVTLFGVIIIAGMILGMFYVYFPLRHIELIKKYSEQYSLEPAFVCSVINAESRFDKEATSHKGASGLMQITEHTGDWIAGEMGDELGMEDYDYSQIYDPELNINIGCYYLQKLLKLYDGDVTLTLAAYNAGLGNVRKWLSDPQYSEDGKTLTKIPFKETRGYIQKVKFNINIYSYVLKMF